MYEYLDDKYEDEPNEPKRSYPVFGVFISLFVLMFIAVLFKSLIFKDVISCNEAECAYTKYNIYAQVMEQKKFTRNDIRSMYVTHELHDSYKNRNDFYENVYIVDIGAKGTFHVSEDAYIQLKRYFYKKYKEIYVFEYKNKLKAAGYAAAGILSVLFLFGFISQSLRGGSNKKLRKRKKSRIE